MVLDQSVNTELVSHLQMVSSPKLQKIAMVVSSHGDGVLVLFAPFWTYDI